MIKYVEMQHFVENFFKKSYLTKKQNNFALNIGSVLVNKHNNCCMINLNNW